jgi:hypothetical protein
MAEKRKRLLGMAGICGTQIRLRIPLEYGLVEIFWYGFERNQQFPMFLAGWRQK